MSTSAEDGHQRSTWCPPPYQYVGLDPYDRDHRCIRQHRRLDGAPHYLDETIYHPREAAWAWMRGFNLEN